MADRLTVAEFLALEPRAMDGYFAEHVLGYTRIQAPPDAFGDNGGNDILVPPGGIPDGFMLPPKGRIGLNYMAPVLVDRRDLGHLRNLMWEFGFRYSAELGDGCAVAFVHKTDGRRGSYRMSDATDKHVCTMVAACLALGILETRPPAP